MTPAEPLEVLDFPPGDPLRTRGVDGHREILDRVRRRFVRLTPEEWVRQHLLRTLIDHLGYPPGLIVLEPAITTAAGARRPDVVVFDRDRHALLIAECKAPSVKLDRQVFEQVSRYNVATSAPVLLVTNGRKHYCWRVDHELGKLDFLASIPSFGEVGNP